MSSRDDEIDALVCAGGAVDVSGNPTGLTYASSCLTDMTNWDQSQNMMVLMSQMPNEYDQGSTTCTGSPYSCYNGHLPGGFQGIMYSTADCLIHQNFQDSGPVICNTITLPDEGGVNPTFYVPLRREPHGRPEIRGRPYRGPLRAGARISVRLGEPNRSDSFLLS